MTTAVGIATAALGAQRQDPLLRAESQFVIGRDQLKDLRHYARRLVPNFADADDLAQDAVECALRKLHHQFTLGGNPRAWLYRVMRNLAVDGYRRARRERRGSSSEYLALPAPVSEPEAEWAQVSHGQLLEAVQELTPPLRETYELQLIKGLSPREISDRLGVPRATVGTRLLRARQRLRLLLRA